MVVTAGRNGRKKRSEGGRLRLETLEPRLVLDSTVVFNEIMYHPAGDGDALEWVELYNQMGVDMDISGWSLAGGIEYSFPDGTILSAGGYLAVAASPEDLQDATGFGDALGPFTGRLSNGGEELLLMNNSDRVMDSLDYGDDLPWPVAPDGGGVSLEKADPRLATAPAANWTFSRIVGGTPGSDRSILLDTPVQFDTTWSFDQSGADLGTNWREPGFDDGAWPTGAGLFHEGVRFLPGPMNTPLELGPTTFYFRTTFDFFGDPARAQLELSHIVDDGAVFYLNGVEIDRFSMPPGEVTAATLAETVRTPEIVGPVSIAGDSLVQGRNTLAVEVHQVLPTSTDVVFGAELKVATQLSSLPAVALNEVESGAAETFSVELINHGAAPIDLAGYSLESSTSVNAQFSFGAQILMPGELLALTENELGYEPRPGDRLFLYTPGGGAIADAVSVTGRLQGRFPRATGEWLVPAEATFGAANRFELSDDVVINEIMYRGKPSPTLPSVEETTTILPVDATWRFDDSGADLGTSWRDVGFDDGAWASGQGLFFVESSGLPAPKNTPLTLGATTYYFRTTFELTGDPSSVLVQLRPIIDDGAVFYLNGAEILRQRMPDGEITFDSLSERGVGNAGFEGPFAIQPEGLVLGTNTLAVEVHQASASSNDVVFGTELLKTEVLVPAQEFAESSQEWIELYNRGAEIVDLSNWTLRDGVDFQFAPGTMIAPGEYLVVAKDPQALASRHPEIDVVGPFDRSLSNRSDRIVLADAVGNPADSLQYFDRGRWDQAADGGGASLELRNPRADNSQPEAWAASRQGERSGWQTITYSGLGASLGNDPTRYNEFLLGLLDAGEVLLDDISVLEIGGRVDRELIQNGDFESGDTDRWRIIGNQHGEVVVDPDDPNNLVLHLTASGATEHMHNNAGTTLKADGSFVQISSSREYEISFRARWVSGSNQLNSRLYFNRLSRTTLLDVPEVGGSPGGRNSTFEENLGPTYSQLRHGPIVPAANEPVEVSVAAEDADGIAAMLLWYSVGGDAWMSVAMQPDGNGMFQGTIPGQRAARIVQFYVEGEDTLGVKSTFPAAGADSRALYIVEDGKARLDDVHNFRIIMTQPDADFLHLSTNVMSNDRIGATVVYNEAEVFYNVGVRLKGSQRGRNRNVRVGFNVEFDPTQLFRGVHRTVGIDRSGAGDQFSQKEILVKHGMNHAGNMPSLYDDVIRVIAPRDTHTGSALLVMARYNDVFLDSQYASGSAGTAFEYELIYFPNSTVGNDPEGLKVPNPDSVAGVSLRSLGDDKEAYRWHWIIKNNRQQDDYSNLIRVLQAMATSDTDEYHRLTGELLDVDQWLRSFALQSLFGIGDNYATGAQHNAQFYTRPEDGKTLYLPWDMDFTFSAGATSSVTSNGDLNRLISLPANRRAYFGHVHDIVDTTFNSTYMNPWLEYYSSLLPAEDFGGFASYISTRSNAATSQVNSAVGPVDFAVITDDPLDVGSAGVATIEGDGWVNVREIRLAGSGQALDVEWFENSRWRLTLPVNSGDTVLNLEAYDFQGRLIAADSITVTAMNVERPLVESLRITEIMYHPAEPTADEIAAGFDDDNAFEFVELTNIGAETLDLTGAQFTAGVGFDFSGAGATSLAPGEHLLVVRDRAAFEMRYGTDQVVAGEYSGRLSNGGEQLQLVDDSDVTILDFSYDDAWYPTTDGSGHSLVIVDALAEPMTWGVRSSWRASNRVGGSPGETDPTSVLGDANGDGAVNIDDLNIVRNNFGATGDGVPGDTNGDGRVDVADLNQVRNNFGVTSAALQSPAANAVGDAAPALRFRAGRGHVPSSRRMQIWGAALEEFVQEPWGPRNGPRRTYSP